MGCVLIPWYIRHRHAVTAPIVKSFFQILRSENPDLKIGVAGFCWGGRYALLLGQESFSNLHLVDAVFAGYPSSLSIPKEIDSPYCPVSIAVASMDPRFTPKMAAHVEKVWKTKAEIVKNEIVVYAGAKQGFCVRGNMENDKEKEDMRKAIEQVGIQSKHDR